MLQETKYREKFLDAVGLGSSKTRKGSRIGEKVANDILSLFSNIPQLKTSGREVMSAC